jgi:hypothetical protein
MHDPDSSSLDAVLAETRRQWSPSARDLERVKGRLGAAIARGGRTGATTAPEGGSTDDEVIRSLRVGTSRFAGPHGWLRRVLVTAAFTTAGAGVGYWAGRRDEGRATHPTDVARRPAMTIPLPADPPSREASTAPPTLTEPTTPKVLQSSKSSPVRRNDVRRATVNDGTPNDRGGAERSLADEIRALRNVERALRDTNPGLASAFLDELDRAVPGGRMREERDALRAIARCEAGRQPFGINLAEEFAVAHPGSAYEGRVHDACRRTDSKATGDSVPGGEAHD